MLQHGSVGAALLRAFPDALVLQLAEDAPATRALVTWSARHFRDKTHLPVLTPAEYLEE
jgi:hypothetical protein